MAIIKLYTQDDEQWKCEEITCNSVIGWVVDSINEGENFKIYVGGLSEEHEVSRKPELVEKAQEASVFLVPSGPVAIIAAVVVAVVATVALQPKIASLDNLNRNQQSPNNSLSNRNNEARPNQRIVDICGQVKSIPDVIQSEFAKYVNNTEVRVGYYCVCRGDVLIEEIKDGDTLIEDINSASVGVYGPDKSPNNSQPDIQVGEEINEPVVGVYQSSDAIGQVLQAPNDGKITLNDDCRAFSDGHLEGDFNFSDIFEAGDYVDLNDLFYESDGVNIRFGADTHTITSIDEENIYFDISNDPTWAGLTGQRIVETGSPEIVTTEEKVIGEFRITSQKINRLLVNVYAQNGLYKEDSESRSEVSVEFDVIYQLLNDNFEPIGSEQRVSSTISGRNSDEKGISVEIDLGSDFYVEWSLVRTSDLDLEFKGNVIEEIKLKDVFGLFDINKEHFGNVTTIQTSRSSVAQATAIRNPELNCIATEKVYKYLGNGVFDTELTPNTQAMQSLIRVALDPFIGRREESELDLDLLLSIQNEIESYFGSEEAGSFNYSFDSTQLSAQQILSTIATGVFTTLYREGRVLKGWFERPQSVPTMVFTHRSKQPNNETWTNNFEQDKDSIEFVYTDAITYEKETLYFPTDRSGTNPLRSELSGIKGVNLATWHMMRIYNKMIYQNRSVEFGATAEGRFVRPQRMISVVKGSRTLTSDGNVIAQNGLELTLSQEVTFTEGDEHYIILKRRDGSTESLLVSGEGKTRYITLEQIPSEEIYTGNSALKTEFSFGNEAALLGQQMIAEEIDPSDEQYVNIRAINYSDLYYKDDPETTDTSAYSHAFSDAFN